MDRTSVLELKSAVLTKHYRENLGADPKIRSQGLTIERRPERRIAVGYSVAGQRRRGMRSYRLEVRVQRRTGVAAREAERLQERYGDDVRVRILHRVAMPGRFAAFRPFLDGDGSPMAEGFLQTVSVAALPQASSQQLPAVRPLSIGLSVGRKDSGPGTLGAFVATEDGDAILSNSHVLALSGNGRRGDRIYQPGRGDTQILQSQHDIGSLVDFSVLADAGSNLVDYAIARLDGVEHAGNIVPVAANVPPELIGLPFTGVVAPEQLGPEPMVAKIGRTTGYVLGKLTAVSLDDVPVFVPGIGNVRFDDVLEVTWFGTRFPFSLGGDSGSVVFAPACRSAIGLHFAGGILDMNGKELGLSYACNLGTVLKAARACLIG